MKAKTTLNKLKSIAISTYESSGKNLFLNLLKILLIPAALYIVWEILMYLHKKYKAKKEQIEKEEVIEQADNTTKEESQNVVITKSKGAVNVTTVAMAMYDALMNNNGGFTEDEDMALEQMELVPESRLSSLSTDYLIYKNKQSLPWPKSSRKGKSLKSDLIEYISSEQQKKYRKFLALL